jgi:hypothetical protein
MNGYGVMSRRQHPISKINITSLYIDLMSYNNDYNVYIVYRVITQNANCGSEK